MSETRNLRRYALHKMNAAASVGDTAIRDVWKAKQAEISGTALPSDFPNLTRLAGFFYTTYEDLDGAVEQELTALGFNTREATEILAAAS